MVGDTTREGSASADRGESHGTCRKARRGACRESAKGMRRGRDRPKRAKRTATLTSREFQATRMDLDRAGSHTER